jgi:hypothetical protein
MAKKLTHASSVQIVQRALRAIREPLPLSSGTRLGEILLTPSEGELFRNHVQAAVKAEGFEIQREHIPTELDFTIEHVASAVCSLSGLAGNSGTDDE